MLLYLKTHYFPDLSPSNAPVFEKKAAKSSSIWEVAVLFEKVFEEAVSFG